MRKALIVGINNYDKASQLTGCENDATAVKEILGLHADGRRNFTIIKPKEDIKTKVGLLEEIKALFDGNTETNVALLYFSGHGGYDNGRYDGYIITSDCIPIYMGEILDAVNMSKCRNRIVILEPVYNLYKSPHMVYYVNRRG